LASRGGFDDRTCRGGADLLLMCGRFDDLEEPESGEQGDEQHHGGDRDETESVASRVGGHQAYTEKRWRDRGSICSQWTRDSASGAMMRLRNPTSAMIAPTEGPLIVSSPMTSPINA